MCILVRELRSGLYRIRFLKAKVKEGNVKKVCCMLETGNLTNPCSQVTVAIGSAVTLQVILRVSPALMIISFPSSIMIWGGTAAISEP